MVNRNTHQGFVSRYEKAWLPLAHVLGIIGNAIFLFICVYEYGILLILWGSRFAAIIVPPFLELLQWFFAKIAVKQKIFEEQQAQLKSVNDYMDKFCAGESDEDLRQMAYQLFIERNDLHLLRGGDMIPPSAIPSTLIYSFVVVTLVVSTLIITLNRNESNQKVVNTEIKAALAEMDSLHTIEVSEKREITDAAINVNIVAGSADNEKAISLNNQIEKINNEIALAKKGMAVERMKALKALKIPLEKSLGKLPLSQVYAKKNSEIALDFATWKSERDSMNRVAKKNAETKIREKHTAKGTRINWFAIITNILYVVFQYVIVKIRTITGTSSFDLIESIGMLLGEMGGKIKASLDAEVKGEVKEVNGEEKEVSEVKSEVIEKDAKVFDMPIRATAQNQQKTGELPITTMSYTKNTPSVWFEEIKKTGLKRYMEDSKIEIGGRNAEQVWQAIRNGRAAIIAGKLDSQSITTMNELLSQLEKYKIFLDKEDKMESTTPQLLRKFINSKAISNIN